MPDQKLSPLKVAKIATPGRYGDGAGLWLQVTEFGEGKGRYVTKSWLFRYTRYGRAREMGLGPLHTLGLGDAREKARQARALLLEGQDPIEARKKQRLQVKAAQAALVTFKGAAERYIAAHKAGWRNAKHSAQWTATLETYAYPILGELSVADIETAHLLKVLEPIWTTKTETASRVRGRVEAVLDWATARRYRSGENPARWRGHLDKLLPARTKVRRVTHHAAMPFENVPTFVAALQQLGSVSALAMEFVILTACRTSEGIGATWPEIDLGTSVWTVPGHRMKSGREHRVPLSRRAIAILKAVPRIKGNDHLFPGARPEAGLSNMALLELLRGMRPGLTVHGFRSSFRDWAGETTQHSRDVIEIALAHAIADKTEAAYRRGDALTKRRQLMDDWATYCGRSA